ncbi:MAG: indolepyruvate ferredoxin oxidoreductase subunit alpha [Treponema sp.]|jgi:indolepyruvate ferredoxin oxidoreductase alpha subunit|nr:indolepyruvate ferredoxin oxidoreductase subunit alpha [Treponema sp.]
MALLGDEAAALGAVHAGISAAYGYPGTPSTEILEYLIARYEAAASGDTDGPAPAAPPARWGSNEKTALETALGVSFAGRRVLVTMKHVGLNVAADPFINGALLDIKGGLVIAVADDPGMHSSQNEQDSRFYAQFAMVPCLEPRNQQEAYDMAGEAFDLSERFHVPVLLRMVTRLSHARAAVRVSPAREQNKPAKAGDRTRWMLLPAYARRNYGALIEKQAGLAEWSAAHPANKLELEDRDRDRVVISSGLGGNYYEENLADLIGVRGKAPARLHIGAYPLPEDLIRRLCAGAKEALVIEEGQPFIETSLRGILPQPLKISGRLNPGAGTGDAAVPRTGELDPDNVREALGLPPRPSVLDGFKVSAESAAGAFTGGAVSRPPQLCAGCPHADSYETIKKAVAELDGWPEHPHTAITADIGCYSLGAAPPHSVPETIVCMGASIGMARGAAEAGIRYALGIIGDSTFLHSGITGLADAAAADTPMTVAILDNATVAMTGCQKTILPSAGMRDLILGLGVKAGHLAELEAKKQFAAENAARLKAELSYRGLSVVIFRRECLEAFRRRSKKS